MSLSSQKWLVAVAAIIAATLGYAEPSKVSKTPAMNYTCPAKLVLGEKTYPLEKANVFDGPIEDRVALVPEPAPDVPKRSIWKHEADQRTLHVKCRYQGVAHYIVLEAKNARQCTAHTANSVVRVECE